jgi:hypothetical protein
MIILDVIYDLSEANSIGRSAKEYFLVHVPKSKE